MALTVFGDVMTGAWSTGPIDTTVDVEADRAGVPEAVVNVTV